MSQPPSFSTRGLPCLQPSGASPSSWRFFLRRHGYGLPYRPGYFLRLYDPSPKKGPPVFLVSHIPFLITQFPPWGFFLPLPSKQLFWFLFFNTIAGASYTDSNTKPLKKQFFTRKAIFLPLSIFLISNGTG